MFYYFRLPERDLEELLREDPRLFDLPLGDSSLFPPPALPPLTFLGGEGLLEKLLLLFLLTLLLLLLLRLRLRLSLLELSDLDLLLLGGLARRGKGLLLLPLPPPELLLRGPARLLGLNPPELLPPYLLGEGERRIDLLGEGGSS